MPTPTTRHNAGSGIGDSEALTLNPIFERPGEATTVAKDKLPAGEMDPTTAFQIVRDEAMLDGNNRQNLATFTGTWMDEYADEIYKIAFDRNIAEKDEHPQSTAIDLRCTVMMADLWNAPDPSTTTGTSTVGSSEACMLGGLAFKRRWQLARKAAGKSAEKPNFVMSSAVQVCWEKFCNYFDIEPRYVPISEDHKVLDGYKLEDYVDENTIGVVAIMGVTYTGMYEPVKEIAAKLDEIQEKTGLDIPIHVDGASAGMITPFVYPDLEWDFRIERVKSINTSGHKFGLVYPGLGWVIWRTKEDCPEDLIFSVSYLGGSVPTLGLNFSRPGAQVLLQYYLFLRLGFDGYRRVQQGLLDTAQYLSSEIAKMPDFVLWNDGSEIPVFAWHLKDGASKNWTLYDLSDRLKMKGWQCPAYPMPADLPDLVVQRIVVRNGLSRDLAEGLLADIKDAVAYLDSLDGPLPKVGPAPSAPHGGRS
ncbi:MAG: glutamate decarboxylase [Gordonia sp. (in: high G+C Gram-positive bacteria)]